MAEIVVSHAPTLRNAGFKKRRHSFNRPVADGMVHTLCFWMAEKEPPAWTEVPGLREREYGSFTLSLGVHVPEMNRMGAPRSDWINDFDAALHPGPGRLIPNLRWWLADPAAGDSVGQFLVEHALPWLDRFPDRAAVLDAYERAGPLAIGLSPAGGLDIADTYRAMGRTVDERRTLESYVAHGVRSGHVEYLTGYLQKNGHSDLIALIKAH